MAIYNYFQREWIFSEAGPALTSNLQKFFGVLKDIKTLIRHMIVFLTINISNLLTQVLL